MNKDVLMKHLLKTFSGIDNQSLDLGRILWALGTLVFFAMSIHSVWKGQAFDAISWGAGFSAVLAGGGAALWMKKDTEPQTKVEEKPKE